MYQDIKQLYGRKLRAADGDIGHVQDFYFDDATWAIRYVVVDPGAWLPGCQVLLPPHAFGGRAFGQPKPADGPLEVTPTRGQIEGAPRLRANAPVSRPYEAAYFEYFGWPVYWEGGGLWGAAEFPATPTAHVPAAPADLESGTGDANPQRSTKAITGYRIMATDGAIGVVSGFTVEIWSWTIREVVVETGHWYAGKPIFLLPESIRRISHEDAYVFVTLATSDIRQARKNGVVEPLPSLVGTPTEHV